MTTTDRPDLMWGYGARMRACRSILGLTAPEFADRFNVKRRTVQRIERGEDPLPMGLWAEVYSATEDIVSKANTILDAVADDERPLPVRVDLDNQHDVAVVAVAYLLEPDTITPVTAEDEETSTDDEIPGAYAGSAQDRG